MEPKFKIWLEQDGEVLVGNGKIGLLQRIDDTGSIHKAAEPIGMSYRHAWGFVQKIEKRSGLKFLETQVGGREGGGARLTPEGKAFLVKYAEFPQGLDD